jgi:transcriptional regulator with XRE-family HTH domain
LAFYDKFVNLCASIGEKPTPVAQKLGISKGTVASWKRRGNDPTDAYLAKIANYFGVSVDDLRGNSENEKKPTAQGNGLKLDSYEDIDQWLDTLDGKGLDMVIAMAAAKKVKVNEDKS